MNKNTAFAFCAALFLLNACSSTKKAVTGGTQLNTLTQQEKNDGWQLLFDGKTTNGWHTYNRDTVSKNWKVVDGTLVMNPEEKTTRGMEDIITNNEYENYELSVEWRIFLSCLFQIRVLNSVQSLRIKRKVLPRVFTRYTLMIIM